LSADTNASASLRIRLHSRRLPFPKPRTIVTPDVVVLYTAENVNYYFHAWPAIVFLVEYDTPPHHCGPRGPRISLAGQTSLEIQAPQEEDRQ
jgi:hypothetical protein